MEKKEEFIKRENKRQFFDKRLIKEIVKSISDMSLVPGSLHQSKFKDCDCAMPKLAK